MNFIKKYIAQIIIVIVIGVIVYQYFEIRALKKDFNKELARQEEIRQNKIDSIIAQNHRRDRDLFIQRRQNESLRSDIQKILNNEDTTYNNADADELRDLLSEYYNY